MYPCNPSFVSGWVLFLFRIKKAYLGSVGKFIRTNGLRQGNIILHCCVWAVLHLAEDWGHALGLLVVGESWLLGDHRAGNRGKAWLLHGQLPDHHHVDVTASRLDRQMDSLTGTRTEIFTFKIPTAS